MQNKFNQFYNLYNGKSIEFSDTTNKYQFDNGYQLWDNISMKLMLINSKTFGLLKIKLDDEDYDKVVSLGKWCASFDRGKYYFHKRISSKDKITLHRYLMGFPRGKYVDHINGDTLDNRKENLRICSNAANLRNGKLRPNNKSGYTGISKRVDYPNNPYVAKIRVNYKYIYLGSFSTFGKAVEARKEGERKYWND